MEKSRLERKVGLFVFIGLTLLAVLLVQFNKGTSLFRGTYTLKLHAANIGGLKQKSAVLLAGVGVGSVQHISLDQGGTNTSVTITLQIYKDYPIFHDARFVIEQSGFLGDQFVSVIPTTNSLPVLTNGADVECQAPFNLQEVARGAAGFVQRLDETAKKLDASVTDLRAQLLNEQTLANFGVSITNLRMFTEQALDTVGGINGIITTNREQVGAAVSNIVLFSTQLNQLGNSAQDILATNGANLTAATKNIKNLTVSVQQ
ncbi:MAG TPA: MlaD family protein, partial [Verrucomicrobiae bacterium]